MPVSQALAIMDKDVGTAIDRCSRLQRLTALPQAAEQHFRPETCELARGRTSLYRACRTRVRRAQAFRRFNTNTERRDELVIPLAGKPRFDPSRPKCPKSPRPTSGASSGTTRSLSARCSLARGLLGGHRVISRCVSSPMSASWWTCWRPPTAPPSGADNWHDAVCAWVPSLVVLPALNFWSESIVHQGLLGNYAMRIRW